MSELPKSLAARQAERRRRQRRRQKRYRAIFLLVCFIAIIVLIIVAISSCIHRLSSKSDNDTVEVSPTPITSIEPTAEPQALNGIPLPSEENDLLKIIEAADENGGVKTCYLTFDDGPSSEVTASILDTLRRYNVKATFFEVGSIIKSNPDMARRVFEEGHLIANHSQSHNYDNLYASESSFINEVQKAEDAITTVCGEAPKMKLFRFPGGSYNAGDHASEKQTYKKTLADAGYYYIDWNSLTGDAEGRTKNAEELLGYLQSNIDTDYSAVVLMHDASTKKATAEALASVIEYLMSEGYTFKRLDEIDYHPSSTSSSSSSSSTEITDEEEYLTDDDEDYMSEDEEYSDEEEDYDSSSSNTSSGGAILATQAPGSTTRTSVDGKSVTQRSTQ